MEAGEQHVDVDVDLVTFEEAEDTAEVAAAMRDFNLPPCG